MRVVIIKMKTNAGKEAKNSMLSCTIGRHVKYIATIKYRTKEPEQLSHIYIHSKEINPVF